MKTEVRQGDNIDESQHVLKTNTQPSSLLSSIKAGLEKTQLQTCFYYQTRFKNKMKDTIFHVLIAVMVFTVHVQVTDGHGYLMDPPARASMWREPYKFSTPVNYDDNGLNCGGRWVS